MQRLSHHVRTSVSHSEQRSSQPLVGSGAKHPSDAFSIAGSDRAKVSQPLSSDTLDELSKTESACITAVHSPSSRCSTGSTTSAFGVSLSHEISSQHAVVPVTSAAGVSSDITINSTSVIKERAESAAAVKAAKFEGGNTRLTYGGEMSTANSSPSGKEKNLSFKDELLSDWSVAVSRVDSGRLLLERLRAALLQRASAAVEQASRSESIMPMLVATNVETKSVTSAVSALRLELFHQAEHAREYAEALRRDVVEGTLTNTIHNHYLVLQQIKADGSEAQKQLNLALVDYQKATERYVRCSREAAAAAGRCQAAAADEQPAVRTELSLTCIRRCVEARVAEEEYRESVQRLNSSCYSYQRKLSVILQSLQDMDEKRMLCFRDALRKLLIYEAAALRNKQYDLEKTIQAVEKIDPGADLQEFLQQKHERLCPPSVTAATTINALLTTTSSTTNTPFPHNNTRAGAASSSSSTTSTTMHILAPLLATAATASAAAASSQSSASSTATTHPTSPPPSTDKMLPPLVQPRVWTDFEEVLFRDKNHYEQQRQASSNLISPKTVGGGGAALALAAAALGTSNNSAQSATTRKRANNAKQSLLRLGGAGDAADSSAGRREAFARLSEEEETRRDGNNTLQAAQQITGYSTVASLGVAAAASTVARSLLQRGPFTLVMQSAASLVGASAVPSLPNSNENTCNTSSSHNNSNSTLSSSISSSNSSSSGNSVSSSISSSSLQIESVGETAGAAGSRGGTGAETVEKRREKQKPLSAVAVALFPEPSGAHMSPSAVVAAAPSNSVLQTSSSTTAAAAGGTEKVQRDAVVVDDHQGRKERDEREETADSYSTPEARALQDMEHAYDAVLDLLWPSSSDALVLQTTATTMISSEKEKQSAKNLRFCSRSDKTSILNNSSASSGNESRSTIPLTTEKDWTGKRGGEVESMKKIEQISAPGAEQLKTTSGGEGGLQPSQQPHKPQQQDGWKEESVLVDPQRCPFEVSRCEDLARVFIQLRSDFASSSKRFLFLKALEKRRREVLLRGSKQVYLPNMLSLRLLGELSTILLDFADEQLDVWTGRMLLLLSMRVAAYGAKSADPQMQVFSWETYFSQFKASLHNTISKTTNKTTTSKLDKCWEKPHSDAVADEKVVRWSLHRCVYHHRYWNRVVFWEEALTLTISEELQRQKLMEQWRKLGEETLEREERRFRENNPCCGCLPSFGSFMVLYGIAPEQAQSLLLSISRSCQLDEEFAAHLVEGMHQFAGVAPKHSNTGSPISKDPACKSLKARNFSLQHQSHDDHEEQSQKQQQLHCVDFSTAHIENTATTVPSAKSADLIVPKAADAVKTTARVAEDTLGKAVEDVASKRSCERNANSTRDISITPVNANTGHVFSCTREQASNGDGAADTHAVAAADAAVGEHGDNQAKRVEDDA